VGPKHIGVFQGHDVIGHMTNWFAIWYFLLASNWNRTFIFNHFWDVQPQICAQTKSDFIFCPMQCIALDRL